MAARPTVDVRREVAGRLVESIFDEQAFLIADRWFRPSFGDFAFYRYRADVGGILTACAGCGAVVALSFVSDPEHKGPRWNWNGDAARPTLSPSIVHDPKKGGCGWHGFMIAGRFKMKP